MQKIIFIVIFLVAGYALAAQGNYLSKTVNVRFTSTTPAEKIEATQQNALAVINLEKNSIDFSLKIADFIFPNKLMRNHFNDKYMESLKLPKAAFTGTFDTLVVLNNGQTKTVEVNGTLTIKGVSKKITTTAQLTKNAAGQLQAQANFSILLSDYGVAIPSMVKSKINNQVFIFVQANNMVATN
jgi:polyisoprenoid-binding protein YceI